MKTKSNLIRTCLLAAALLLPVVGQAQFTFTTNNGAITITGYTGRNRDVVIPDKINFLPVTSIGDLAFRSARIINILIPNGITSIGYGAFYNCTKLTSITIPNSVTNIGAGAFTFCDGLSRVSLPDSIAKINDQVFFACTSLLNVTIPDSVTSIGRDVFNGCLSLTNVTLGSNVGVIWDEAFESCPNLTAIRCRGNEPILWGGYVFYGCPCMIYYLPGSYGWGSPLLGGRPTVLWNPPVPFSYMTNNGTITITGYTGSDGAVVIPDEINFLPVASIDRKSVV